MIWNVVSTPLAERMKALIASAGPLGVADYFAMCLGDPDHGYYRTREPFGRAGDFVTAPEISQLFGEMIGVFLVHAWHASGRPSGVRLAELGPGRGTMMADVLRVAERLAPDLAAAASVHMVETSERLVAVQRETLRSCATPIAWHRRLDDVPEGFLLLVANEFFDAIPIRQFVKTPDGFRERTVGLAADGGLCFVAGPATLSSDELPQDAGAQPAGTIVEISPARTAIMAAVAGRLAAAGGVALVLDYGHLVTGYGDTLQALKNHAADDPLAHPGDADLTSHVDFAALARAAGSEGASLVGAMTQGDFLLGLGLLERAGNLGAGKDHATQEAIRDAVERLAAPGKGNMGELFKVLAVSGSPARIPPFISRD